MPLVTCPDCGRDVSPSATFCVHCGRPGPFTADASHTPGAPGASPAPGAPYASHAPGAIPTTVRPIPPAAEMRCPRCKMTSTRATCARCDVKTVPIALDRHQFPRVPVEYAGFGARVGAMLLDLLALSPVIVLTIWMHSRPSTAVIAAGAVLGVVAAHGYFIAMHANGGQTLGKRVVGIRVRRTDGGMIGWRDAFVRDLPFLVPGAVAVLGILLALAAVPFFDLVTAGGYVERAALLDEYVPGWADFVGDLANVVGILDLVVLLVDKRRRSLRDHLAGTVVVGD
jgi:uncharacterized RDD family membrane protein YckC